MAPGMEVKFSSTTRSYLFSAMKVSSCLGLTSESVMKMANGLGFNHTVLVNRHFFLWLLLLFREKKNVFKFASVLCSLNVRNHSL